MRRRCSDDDRLFVTSFYDGSLMLELGQPTRRPPRRFGGVTAATRSTPTPCTRSSARRSSRASYIYGVDSYGELRCLDAETGDRVWEDLTAVPTARWSTIHFVQNGDHIWMFNERGELIIAKLSPKGYEEISRAKLIEPTREQLRQRGGVCWSHPAYANKCVFARMISSWCVRVWRSRVFLGNNLVGAASRAAFRICVASSLKGSR